MAQRKMLGDFIYTMRREKGLSQSELGALVGVSNKAVSKWETNEANPDVGIIKELSDALGVSADELLSCKRNDEKETIGKDDTSSNSHYPPSFFESVLKLVKTDDNVYSSKSKTASGTPYVQISLNPKVTAKGILSIGIKAKGIVSLGILAMGLLSCGIMSIGLISLGLVTIGLLAAVGGINFGGVAVGGIVVGVVAVGGIAIGFLSVGGIAIGYYAYTGVNGIVIGIHRYISVDNKSIPYEDYHRLNAKIIMSHFKFIK